jgi:hypothetical protein
VVKRVRGIVSLTLSLALDCLNAEAATMHVHRGGDDAAHHHDGPAFHDHDEPAVPTTAEIGPAGGGRTIPLSITSCPPVAHQPVVGIATGSTMSIPDRPSRLAQQPSTVRAHGPPPGGSCSLRAPPRFTLA